MSCISSQVHPNVGVPCSLDLSSPAFATRKQVNDIPDFGCLLGHAVQQFLLQQLRNAPDLLLLSRSLWQSCWLSSDRFKMSASSQFRPADSSALLQVQSLFLQLSTLETTLAIASGPFRLPEELYIINCHIPFTYRIFGLLIWIKAMAFKLVFITEHITGLYEENNNKYWSQVKVI